MKVERRSDGEIKMALRARLRPTRFLLKMTNIPPSTLSKVME